MIYSPLILTLLLIGPALASIAVANVLGALITIWGIAVLAIAKPQYLSLAGKMVVHQEEDSYRVFMQEARK